jgi:hypothetical protein
VDGLANAAANVAYVKREQHVGYMPGVWWRMPKPLRLLKAFDKACGDVVMSAAYTDGTWVYEFEATSKELFEFVLRAAGIQTKIEAPDTKADESLPDLLW